MTNSEYCPDCWSALKDGHICGKDPHEAYQARIHDLYSQITFDSWLKHHPCSTEELWKIQNCLGTLLGIDHDLSKQAVQAWHAACYPPEA